MNTPNYKDGIRQLTQWVDDGLPFFHSRWNDGEMILLNQTRKPDYVSADGSRMHADIGPNLRRMLGELSDLLTTEPDARVQIGSSCWQHPDADSELFLADIQKLDLVRRVRWANGHDLVDGLVTGETLNLLQALRESNRPIAYVSKHDNLQAIYCLRAAFVEIPPIDWWLRRYEIIPACGQMAKSGFTFVWSAGNAKSVSWDIWRRHPQSSHLDFGHIFDGLCGARTREWMRNEEAPWWRPYQDQFLPYVRSFVR